VSYHTFIWDWSWSVCA